MSESEGLPVGTVLGIVFGTLCAVAVVGFCCWWLLAGRFLRSWPSRPLESARPPVRRETKKASLGTPLVPLPLRVELETFV